MKQVKFLPMLIMTLIFTMVLVLGISQPALAGDMPPYPTDTPRHLEPMRDQELPESINATGFEYIWIEGTSFGIYNFDPACEVNVAIPGIGFASTLQADVIGSASQSLDGYPDLEPGMTATASGCGVTKTLVIPVLGIDSVNSAARTVVGHGPANSQVSVWASDGVDWFYKEPVLVDALGEWQADFSLDLPVLTYVEVIHTDAEGDMYSSDWNVPRLIMYVNDYYINFFGFAADTTLTLTVPALPYETTYLSDADGGGWGFYASNLDLEPGMLVEFTDGVTTKQLILVSLSITEFNVATNTVSGTGPADTSMVLYFTDTNIAYPVVTDSAGVFTFNTLTEAGIALSTVDWMRISYADLDLDEINFDYEPPTVVLLIPEPLRPRDMTATDNNMPFFRWGTVPDGTRYTLEILRVSDASVVASNNYAASVRCDATICEVPAPLALSPDDYTWRVRALTDTTTGQWSDPFSLTILAPLDLASPVLRSPGDDAIVYGGRPTFRWFPVTDANVYDVEMYDSSGILMDSATKGLGACYFNTDLGEEVCDHRIPFDLETAYGDYFWRVKARNNNVAPTQESNWTELRLFSYIQLERTWQISPVDGFSTSDTSPTLQWADITGATMYLMQIRLLDDTLVRQVLVSDEFYCDGTTCTWDVDPALDLGEYKWHVRAKNGRNFGRWTAYRTITIIAP